MIKATQITKISLAPIQGITTWYYRKVFENHFSGVDKYYSPYIRLENGKYDKPARLKDILQENNVGISMVPQIMVNTAKDFLILNSIIEDYGYNELNWNLGCPYPMVTKRKLGAGLLDYPETIISVLEEVLPKTKLKVSLKMRSGNADDKQLGKILPLLKELPIHEIIIHPRYAKQLYKGEADQKLFKSLTSLTQHNIVYNGDITSTKSFKILKSKYSTLNSIMIGRGLITNPFLAEEIGGGVILMEQKRARFAAFHEDLVLAIKELTSGDAHFLNHMQAFWGYFSLAIIDGRKAFKQIKKVKNAGAYWQVVNSTLSSSDWI